MARHFAAADHHVIVTDLDEAQGQALARELGSEAGRASFFRLDVTNEDDWAAAFAAAAAGPGAVNVLINNAGWYRPSIPLKDMSLAVWRRHFEINADGAFLGCREALRSMEGRGGVMHVVDAFVFSIKGLRTAWANETAFRLQCALLVPLVPHLF